MYVRYFDWITVCSGMCRYLLYMYVYTVKLHSFEWLFPCPSNDNVDSFLLY